MHGWPAIVAHADMDAFYAAVEQMAVFDLDWRGASRQLDLFEDARRRNLETMIDDVVCRFVRGAVLRARDLDHPGTVMDGVNLDFLDSEAAFTSAA